MQVFYRIFLYFILIILYKPIIYGYIMIDLKKLMFDKRLSQTKLGEILKIKQPEVSKLINGRRDIKQEHIDLLAAYYGQNTIESYIVSEEVKEVFCAPQARQIQASIIPAEVVEEVKAEIEEAESVPIVPEEPGFNIKEYIEKNEDELERINPSKLLQGAELAEKILGASMLPTFAPGDIVFARFLPDKNHLIDGKTYYFDLKNRPTMIRTVKIEGDTLRLVALHPNFGDVIIHKNDVLNVAKIIGLLRMTFGDQYSEIEAIRTKKDQQIERLIEHIGHSMAEISKSGARTDRVMEQNAELMRKLLEK